MANILPNMGLPESVIGQTPDPEWESNLNESLELIDAHTHLNGQGAPLDPAAINFTNGINGFDFNNTFQDNATWYGGLQYSVTSMPALETSGKGRLVFGDDGGFYYVSPSHVVQISTASGIPGGASTNGFLGDYRVAGGAATYIVSDAGYPYEDTFYFYTSPTPPTDDSGSRAGVAAGFFDVKNDATSPFGYFLTPNNSGNLERALFGGNTFVANHSTWGLSVALDNGGTPAWSAVLTAHESPSSITMSAANPSATDARMYSAVVNGDSATTLIPDDYALVVRAISYAGTGSNTPVTGISYIGNLSNSTGTPANPAANFGFAVDWRMQLDATSFATQAILVRTKATIWNGSAGAYTIIPYAGNTPGTLAFEAGIAADNGTSIGIGVAANRTTSGIRIGAGAATTGDFTVNGNLAVTGSISGASAAITGALTSATIVTTGTIDAGGAITAASTVHSPTLSVTDVSNAPGQNVYNTNSFVTCSAAFTDSGLAQQTNIAGFSHTSTGINIVTFPFALSSNAVLFPVAVSGPTHLASIIAGGAGTNSVTIKCVDGAGAPVNGTISLAVVGG